MHLSMRKSYRDASDEAKAEICNGMGPKGWKLRFNRIWFVSVEEAGNIHDWDYHFGKTIKDKDIADRRFLNNMLRIIDEQSRSEFFRALRQRRAFKYYQAVAILGGPFFWENDKDTVKVEKKDKKYRVVNSGD